MIAHRYRCGNVGQRTNALQFVEVKAQEKSENKLKDANFYALPPSNMRFLTDHRAWRSAWAKACEASCGLSFFTSDNKAPLVVVTDDRGNSGPPTANLKMCYDHTSEMRARVTLDLDSDPSFRSAELMDCDGMFEAVCKVLDERLKCEGVEWRKERAVFFYGSTLAKERTGHLVFLDACFRNVKGNAFKSAHGKKVKKLISTELDAALVPYGVGSDMSIATSGLRYEFTDKLEKDKTWRGGVALPTACWNVELELMKWEEMIGLIDPLVIEGDEAWDKQAVWETDLDEDEEIQPSRKRPANVAAVAAVAVVAACPDGTVAQRVAAVFPLFQNILCKQMNWREGVDLYVSTECYCPLKQADHSSRGKVKIQHFRGSNDILIGCFPCEAKGVAPCRIKAPQVARQEGEKRSIVNQLNERHFMAPIGTRGNNRYYVWTLPRTWDDDFRWQLPTEFTQSISNKIHYYYDENDKRKKMLHAKMWLDSLARREFASGTMCAPMGSPDGYFNTWRGFEPRVMELADNLQGESKEDLKARCPWLWEHLRVNVCNNDKDLRRFIIGWLQFLFLKLDKKSGVALVLSGEPGCGKSYFFECILSIVGMHHGNVTHDSNAMSATFAHGKSADMRLEVFDEATTHNDPRKRGVINGLITSSKVRRERKFHEAETVNSFTNLIICSNYARAVDAIVGERRFQFADVRYRVSRMSKKDFFDAAHQELMDVNSLAAFYLLCRDHHKKEFHPLAVVQNEALWRNVYLGLEPMQKWWYGCLRYGELAAPQRARVVRVTGDADEDERQEELVANERHSLWDSAGAGQEVPLRVLRESITAFSRACVPTNSEVEALLRKGNTDVFAFLIRRIGGRGAQEPCITLPLLSKARSNFAEWIQFPADKIFTVWGHELK